MTRIRSNTARLFGSLLMNLLLPNILLAQVSVLTANYDNSRSNSNLNETTLNTSNVNSISFGMVGSFPVDGQIYAQPLYASGVQMPGLGARDIVYAVTMHNSVYAIDAADPASITPLWQVNLGASVPSSVLNFTDILPEVGILGTPVIDVTRQAIYVVSDTLENGTPVFRIHALSLTDGHEMFNGPAVIAATVAGGGAGSSNGMLSFDASLQLQRPGLALANGIVYASFGSHADSGNYHGWIIGYSADDLSQQTAVYNSTPNDVGASFWQGGRAPAIDNAGNVIAVTANGEVSGPISFTNSILKLNGQTLSVLDWFTPDNDADLDEGDLDLGSAGAVLMSGGTQVLTGGKSGELVLVNANMMGHLGPLNSPAVQSFQATKGGIGGGMYNLALWQRQSDAVVYVQEPCGALMAYPISGGQLNPNTISQSNPATCTLFSGIVVSANGDAAGTGIVWQTTSDYSTIKIPGALRAFDATDLTHELWNSDMVPDRDSLGRFAKFVAPTVVNGRVYVPTFSNRLDIYGLLATATSTNTANAEVTAVANGASLLQGAISPGEAIAIYGANIGPRESTDLQIDDTGHAASLLAGTRVYFDSIPAPLIYVSQNEVDPVVPFGITGPTTVVKVTYGGRTTSVTVPVVQAAPALFAINGTGGGQGAILNADGSPNSGGNPAKRGSIVSLYGTGLGPQTSSEDGMIFDGLTDASTILPVTALVDDQPAEVLYAGAAPGMVNGFAQVNVRIPDTVNVYGGGYTTNIYIVLKAGNYTSPRTVTVSVVE